MLRMPSPGLPSLSAPPISRVSALANAGSAALQQRIQDVLAAEGGWLPFDRFMALALYEPGLGYYTRGSQQFGLMPAGPALRAGQAGSDFVTAPELSPLFGQALARQVLQALDAAQASHVLEFGAGSGALAQQLLQALGPRVQRYSIVDVSGTLRQRQAERLAPWGSTVQWLDAWPSSIHGVVVGNEVLDAMPVQLLHFDGLQWWQRGVVFDTHIKNWAWADRATDLRPPGFEQVPWQPGTVTEVHPQAEAFVRSLAATLRCGAAFFIDYGFPEAEYYHPQRSGGTLMCHQAHRADSNPLLAVGSKDITAHVNFSGIALAAQDAGLQVLGYTSQAHFLINCGIMDLLVDTSLQLRANAQKLLTEHEMGELFKVLGLARGVQLDALGFAQGDRSHTL
jgi:SAM-dependent MidA family methyltransferase